MIAFVTGKPGDGKSMYGMHLIARSLMETERIIVTNIPIKVPELAAYLASKGHSVDLTERLILLKHEEVFEFYRMRSGGYVLPPSPDWVAAKESEERGRKLKRDQFIAAMQSQLDEMKKHPEALTPCEYHIDEAHDYFSAREWADTGRGLLWYASKHRHLHDEVILYTQVMANVEKQLRGLASETVRVRNQIRMAWGPFRKAPIFRIYFYYGAPEKIDSATAYNQATMRLDPAGLASTYNSAGAVGVHKTPETVKNRAPLPYWALPAAIAVLALLGGAFLAFAPWMAGKWAGKAMVGATQAATSELLPTPARAVQTGSTAAGSSVSLEPSRTAVDLPRVTGVVLDDRRLLVAVAGHGWSQVDAVLPGDRLRLRNGLVIDRAAVVNEPRQ